MMEEMAMTENFLEEQLKRIREMTEQMSRVRNDAAELSQEFERHRAMMRRSPLDDITDLRSYPSTDTARDHAEDHGGRQAPRRTPRSRRK
jgi:hypothetical protein